MKPLQPVLPPKAAIYALLALLLGVALVAAFHLVRSLYLSWRNDRQLVDERRLRRGARELKRTAHLFEDLQ